MTPTSSVGVHRHLPLKGKAITHKKDSTLAVLFLYKVGNSAILREQVCDSVAKAEFKATDTKATFITHSDGRFYSDLIASSALILTALFAGEKPEIKPMSVEKPSAKSTSQRGIIDTGESDIVPSKLDIKPLPK